MIPSHGKSRSTFLSVESLARGSGCPAAAGEMGAQGPWLPGDCSSGDGAGLVQDSWFNLCTVSTAGMSF